MLENLKTVQQTDLETKVKEFVILKKNGLVYTEKIKEFIRNCQQNRDVICHFQSNKSNTSLNNLKVVTGYYIKQIDLLRSLLVFNSTELIANSNYIKFTWYDTLRKSNVSSIDFEFEYYNALYNLGMIYFITAKNTHLEGFKTEDIAKATMKTFKYAAGIFDKIKNEASLSLKTDIPLDLSPEYMAYCSKVCIAYGQIEIVRYLESKKSYSIIPKLAKGISDLFSNLALIASKEFSSYFDNSIKQFLANKKVYWELKNFSFLKEEALVKFNAKGLEYGTALAYQELVVEKMEKYMFDDSEFPLANENAILEDMMYKNNQIYHCVTPNLELNTYQGEVKVEGVLPDELMSCPDYRNLQDLIPQAVLDMVIKYKDEMMTLINPILSQNESEETIDFFLKAQNLLDSFAIDSSDKIPDEIWNIILSVQEKGGYSALTSTIESIKLKSLATEKKLNEALRLLQLEDQDDSQQRKIYGDNWLRDPSQKVNVFILQELKSLLTNLLKTREYDDQAKKEIYDLIAKFDELSLSKAILEEKIPKRKDPAKLSKTKEAIELKQSIDKLLNDLKPKCAGIIKRIHDVLSGGVIQKQFVEIYNKKVNEVNTLQQSKTELFLIVDQLRDISKEIKSLKEEILKKKEAFQKIQVKDNVADTNEKEKYKSELKANAALYLSKHNGLMRGASYYNNLEAQVMSAVNKTQDFVTKRNQYKLHLINYITKGIPFPDEDNKPKPTDNYKYAPSDNYLNPQTNLFTNMKVKNYNSNNSK